MPRSAIVLLLLGAAAFAHAAEEVKTSPMFDNWMYQRSSPKVHSAGYREIETESVCLIPKSKENCRFLGCACEAETYYQTPVACCGYPVHEGPLDVFAERPTIGRCKWEEKLFDTPITGKDPKTANIGTFEVICDMHDDSDKCSDALCDGMKLYGKGDIMTYTHVAFVGYDPQAPAPKCENVILAPAPAQVAQKTPAKIQYAHDEEHRHVYHMAKGVIYIGTFKAVSHNQPAKYESGKIQLAYPAPNLFETDWVVDDQLPSHDYFITKNGRIELEFVKSEAH